MGNTPSTRFYKYEGTGNDFVILHESFVDLQRLTPQMVKWICDRRFGVGADGLIVVHASSGVDYTMLYFNADGHPGSMCGNGARCAFHYARKSGLAGPTARFQAYDGVHTARERPDGLIEISMQDVDEMAIHDDAVVVDTGSPHYVQFVDVIADVDVLSEGRTIRNRPEFAKEGINVNFVQVARDRLLLRTYERGVEEVTLSCGTGATAAALAYAALRQQAQGPVRIDVLGGSLEVGFTAKDGGGFTRISLAGPAT
ncbi:MAG: diaminopimelate epimerase, partial [Saprospiraceae bacterium]|nr:diaminopimelate epimerase [Saprospiraceae bacterium]